jgi:recombination associated protein RdgC
MSGYWFRNLQAFGVCRNGLALAPGDVFQVTEEKVGAYGFREPAPLQFSSEGWVPPVGEALAETVRVGGRAYLVLCHCRQEKVLPPSSVAYYVEQEAAMQARANGGLPLSRRQRREIREAVVTRLLPQALPRNTRTRVIVTSDGWLWIDTASRGRAENIVSCLRETLGGLRVRHSAENWTVSPELAFTYWVEDTLPAAPGFALDDVCWMRAREDAGRTARFRGVPLDGEAIRTALEDGMRVVRVGLTWQDRVAFTLDADLALRGLQFLDVLRDEAAEDAADDEASRFAADMAIQCAALRRITARLHAADAAAAAGVAA